MNEDLALVSHVSLPSPHSTGYLFHGLDHSCLIVGQHDGDKDSVWTENGDHFLVIHSPSRGTSLHYAKFYRKIIGQYNHSEYNWVGGGGGGHKGYNSYVVYDGKRNFP